MRAEKQFLVDEIEDHLNRSNYVFLADFSRVTVQEAEELRESLAELDAEFHVVKNSAFRVAVGNRDFPDLDEFLFGPTAIVVGGDNPPGVAKTLGKFKREKQKVDLKAGVLDQSILRPDEIEMLAKLPSLDVMRGQFLGLLNTPAQQMVSILVSLPRALMNLLKAKCDKEEAGDS